MFILIFILTLTSSFSFAQEDKPFVVNKYLGLWYETYSIPNYFQKNCLNVTANYSLNDNGTIKVINTCRDATGVTKKEVEGQAVLKSLTNRYLKVYFYRPFGLNLWGGDYYVLALEKNYQWAIVGTPNHKYGWILSRKPFLTPSELTIIKDKIKQLGFDWDDFIKTSTDQKSRTLK